MPIGAAVVSAYNQIVFLKPAMRAPAPVIKGMIAAHNPILIWNSITMPFKDHFSRDSAAYKSFRPSYDIGLVDHLAKGLICHKLAVDVGCGNGQFSRLLATRFDRVIALDASAAQVGEAEPHARISYRVGTAETLDVPDGSADLICALQAAHWFDLEAFYAKANRALRPGGALALVGYGLLAITPELDAAIYDFYTRGIGNFWPADRVHIDTQYADFDFPYDEPKMPPYAMTADWSFAQLKGYMGTWSAIGAAKKVLGFNPLDAFVPKLAEIWGNVPTRPVRWPVFMRYGIKPGIRHR